MPLSKTWCPGWAPPSPDFERKRVACAAAWVMHTSSVKSLLAAKHTVDGGRLQSVAHAICMDDIGAQAFCLRVVHLP